MTDRGRLAALLTAVGLVVAPLAAAPARAAPPADSAKADAGKEITVTGRALSPRKAVSVATHAITAPSDGQVARFTARICPAVEGFEDRYDRIVEDRIREDAHAARIDVDKPGCRPNLIVMAVPDGHKMLQSLAKADPGLFAAIPETRRHHLLEDVGPVRVLNLTELRPAEGPAIGAVMDLVNTGKDAPSMLVRDASILNLTTRQDISGSLVLIDTPRLMGKTLRQIADYAAMRALAVTKAPDEAPAADTILDLFAVGRSAPPALTSFDMRYLEALYGSPADRAYNVMVGQIASHIDHAAPGRDAAR